MNLERNIVQQSFSAHVCHLVSDVTRQSKPENYCVLNFAPSSFPYENGSGPFPGKKPWGRGCREVLSSPDRPDPDPTSSPGSSRFPRGSEMTLGTRLVQTVDWCLSVSLSFGFCAITDCVMKMSRVQLTPQARKTLWYPGSKC